MNFKLNFTSKYFIFYQNHINQLQRYILFAVYYSDAVN